MHKINILYYAATLSLTAMYCGNLGAKIFVHDTSINIYKEVLKMYGINFHGFSHTKPISFSMKTTKKVIAVFKIIYIFMQLCFELTSH